MDLWYSTLLHRLGVCLRLCQHAHFILEAVPSYALLCFSLHYNMRQARTTVIETVCVSCQLRRIRALSSALACLC